MVANRVARGRERANQILALNSARRHHFPPPRRHRQVALAYRARLSRAQAGGGARPLRRTWVARLPPPRDAMHRSLRVPDLRAGGDSPLVWGFGVKHKLSMWQLGIGIETADICRPTRVRWRWPVDRRQLGTHG